MIILFLLVFLGNITALATTSRELQANSRDKGPPFRTGSQGCLHLIQTKSDFWQLTDEP